MNVKKINESLKDLGRALISEVSSKEEFEAALKQLAVDTKSIVDKFNAANKNGILKAEAGNERFEFYYDFSKMKDKFIDQSYYEKRTAVIYVDDKAHKFFENEAKKLGYKKPEYNNTGTVGFLQVKI